MAKKKYSAAIIGTGRIGFTLGFDKKREQPASHVMALRKNRRVRLNFACDNDQTTLDYFKRFYPKVATFSNYSHLFASTKPDIVVIAVNEKSHLETTLAAIRSRPQLIILEKPVALNWQDGIKIQNEAQKFGIPVMVNHERRFALDYKVAKNYINKIGEIICVNARLDSGLYVYNPEKELTGEYSLLHDGTHLVDCIMYLLEDEQKTDKKIIYNPNIINVVRDEKNPKIVRNICVHLQSHKCQDIFINLSGKSKFFGFEIDIIGTIGRIRIGNGIFEFYQTQESKLYSGFYSLEIDKKVKKPKKTKYFSNMLKNGTDFLDKKAELKSTLQNGIDTLEILEGIKYQIKY